jgi:hypothetical protein
MRASLLLLLGGILVWFVWNSFGNGTATAQASTPPDSAPTAASAAGSSPANGSESAAKKSEPAAPKTEPDAPKQKVVAKVTDSEGAKPFAKSAQAALAASKTPENPAISAPSKAQGPADSHATGLASDVELGRALVSDPQGFAAVVSSRSDLSRARRDYALALSKALTGAEAEASRLLAGLEDSADVRTSEREFLARCIDHRTSGPMSAALESESLLVRAGAMVAVAKDADADRLAGKNKPAAQAYSELLLDYVHAPWSADPAVLRRWSDGLNATQRGYRWDKNGDWPAVTVKVEPGDFLIALRKRVLKEHPDLLLCTGQIERANQTSGGVLRPGQVLRVPTDRARMLVDLDAHWAFYLFGDEVAAAWEVASARRARPHASARTRWGRRRRTPCGSGRAARPSRSATPKTRWERAGSRGCCPAEKPRDWASTARTSPTAWARIRARAASGCATRTSSSCPRSSLETRRSRSSPEGSGTHAEGGPRRTSLAPKRAIPAPPDSFPSR